MADARRWWSGVVVLALVAIPAACTKTGDTTPDGGAAETGFYLPFRAGGKVVSNRLPHVAVDSAGGLRAVYAATAADSAGKRPAYYVTCDVGCTGPEVFNTVALGDGVASGQLTLDPQGRPRLLLELAPDAQGTVRYQYWACDAACAQAESWAGATVALGRATAAPSATEQQRSFALDAQGRPRFAFFANPTGATGLAGELFASCDANCLEPASWRVAKLGDLEWRTPSLALGPDGLPHLAYAARQPSSGAPVVGYLECSQSDCSGANAGQLLIATATAGAAPEPVLALRLTAAGGPRLLLYPGTGTGGDLPAGHLTYLSCDSGCAAARGGWSLVDLSSLGANFGEGGLDLGAGRAGPTARGAPHAGARRRAGVRLVRRRLRLSTEGWQAGRILSLGTAAQELGLPLGQACPDCSPPIPVCPNDAYAAGAWPSLALDAAGNPRIAFEVQRRQSGGTCAAGLAARVSRLAVFPEP